MAIISGPSFQRTGRRGTQRQIGNNEATAASGAGLTPAERAGGLGGAPLASPSSMRTLCGLCVSKASLRTRYPFDPRVAGHRHGEGAGGGLEQRLRDVVRVAAPDRLQVDVQPAVVGQGPEEVLEQ